MKVTKVDLWAVTIVLAVVMALILSGCHTVSGIGKDLQTMSESYTESNY